MNFTDGNIYGADVSFYQDDNNTPQQIDFSKMVSQGASFVIIRGGQNTWIDPDFQYNWTNSKIFPRGSYWFYDDRANPLTQAGLFAGLFNDKPEMEVWLDLELDYGGPYQGYANWKKFINEFRRLQPSITIGIYTGYYYINGKIPTSEYAYFSEMPLWLAWYTNDPSVVKIPSPWTSCLFWQFGTPSVGISWGCESIELDMNKFNGTQESFNQRYGDGEITMTKGLMKAGYTVNVRSAANTVVTQLLAGDAVYGDLLPESPTNTRERISFTKIYRAGGTIEQMSGTCTAATNNDATPLVYYMTLTNEAEPVIPPPVTPKLTTIDMTLAAGSVVTGKDQNGNTMFTYTA